MTRIGHPYEGDIFYEVESSYGNGFALAGGELPVSAYIQDVRVGSGDRHAKLMGFDSPLVKELLEQTKEPILHIEYYLQAGDTLLDDCINRIGSCCTLQSLAFEIEANSCAAADEKSHYYFKGCKPSTVKIASTKNSPYTITIDYEAKSVVTAASGATDPGVAALGNVCAFNIAGNIRRGAGAATDVAYIVNSIDIDISHNLTGYTDHDELEKSYLVEGEMAISGSVDIALNEGGGIHMHEVLSNLPFALRIRTSDATGAEGATFAQLDLPGCEWDLSDVDQNVGGEMMMESAAFTCVPSACTNILSSPTV